MLVGILVAMFAVSASAASVSAISMQDEEPRGTPMSFNNPTLYFYGEENAGTPDTWDAWNHAGTTDPDTGNSFAETNGPFQNNNGALESR